MEREGVETQKLDQLMGFFLQQAKSEATRRKFHYFLAFCSVFLVIVSTLVINQIITKSSIIFLKMSEATHGEIDAWITPSADIIGHTSDGLEYEMGALLNYTAIEAKYNIPGDKESQEILEHLLLTPRKVFSGVKVLREGRAGFYNETSTYQKEKW
jgi:hypothetical protein